MKILLLSDPQSDYGAYYLFNGLCQILGDNNVVTYPFKKSYYGMTDDIYVLDDGKMGCTHPGDNIVAREPNEWSLSEIAENIGLFDCIVLTSSRTYAITALRDLISMFGKCPKLLAFTDHEDGDSIRWDIINEFKPKVIFKRELLINSPHKNIYPLPFSSANNSFPIVDDTVKKWDIFALFGMTHPVRRQIVERLFEIGYEKIYLGLDTKSLRGDYQEKNKKLQGYKEYLINIAQSKIALSIRGHGRDCCRFWEIPVYETLMMMHTLDIQIPHPFQDGVNAVYFKEDGSDLKEKIDYYLAHDDERIRIAKAGKEHLLKWHTNQKRAEYFLSIVKDKIKFNDKNK